MVFSRLSNWLKSGKFPKSVFFILGNELCERFSYYGMRAVLTLYLTQQLLLDRPTAKLVYHGFTMLNYFMPLFGGILADIFLGKFRTILYLSIIYACGNVVLSMTSFPGLDMKSLLCVVIALVVIAIGAGGIKPCVSAFGGDQFDDKKAKARDNFFSVFYFCINVGATISMIVSPIFRANVSCLGLRECYPLAFGFPAALMIVATIIFIAGKPLYRINPAQGTAVVDVARCIWHAIVQRFRKREKRDHWLDYADDRFEAAFIEDVKIVLSILLLFTPLPMFWALFDQQGSTWTLQSAQLDGRLSKDVEIQPDQMDSLNAILVLLFIPLFMIVVYPLLAKCNLVKKPLQKMATGGFLAAIAFVLGGVIHLFVEKNLAFPPSVDHTDIMAINTLGCPIEVKLNFENITLDKYDSYIFKEVPVNATLETEVFLSPSCSSSKQSVDSWKLKISTESEKAYAVAIMQLSDGNITAITNEQRRKRDPLRKSHIRFILVGNSSRENATLAFNQKTNTGLIKERVNFTNGVSESIDVWAMDKCLVCWTESEENLNCSESSFTFDVYKGAVFEVLVFDDGSEQELNLKFLTAVPTDSVPIYVQVPMYVIITAGEVMLSITGLAFAYSQAPSGMKSVLQAAWLLTVAFGNLIVMVVDQIRSALEIRKESMSFFTFAALMIIDMLLFSGLAMRYKYRSL